MIEEEIAKKRRELNESIEKQKEYENVYKLSVELDELIAEFYRESIKKKNKKKLCQKQKEENKILYIIRNKA